MSLSYATPLKRTSEDEAGPAPSAPIGLDPEARRFPAEQAQTAPEVRRGPRVSAAARRRRVTGVLAASTVALLVAAATSGVIALWGVTALVGALAVAYGLAARTLNHRAARRELASAFGEPVGELSAMDWGPVDERLQPAEAGRLAATPTEMKAGEIAAFAAAYFAALALTPFVFALRLLGGDLNDIERHRLLGRLVGFQAYWRSQSLKMLTASVAATATVAVVGAAGSTAFAATTGSYTVQAGDTLSSIASANGTTVAALEAANTLSDPNVLMVGQVLSLSGSGSGSASTTSTSATSTSGSTSSAGGSYTVQAGDTLSAIAAANGTTVAALVAANGLADANSIMVGQVLALSGTASGSTSAASGSTSSPSATSASGSYTVQAGDTLSAIAAANGTTVAALVADNGLADADSIMVGQVLSLTASSASTTSAAAATPSTTTPSTTDTNGNSGSYTVQAGDTIGSIAAAQSTTVAALTSANNLSDPDLIYVGEVLLLGPGSASATTPAATPAATTPAATTPAATTPAATDTTTTAPAAAPASGAALAVQTALAQVGVPYVWGGESPSGFDCSGLVAYAWAAAGVSLPHYTYSQLADTTPISESDLQPGDLIFYDGGGHVAMYIGNGQVVSANTTGTLVQTQSIDYDGTPYAFTRVSS